MILKKYFYLALLMLAPVFVMPSCSDDNDLSGGENPPAGGETVSNTAGDNFYMFVNGEWHAGLGNTGENQGYAYDMAYLLAEKTAMCAAQMDDVKLVVKAFKQSSSEDNEERVGEIIDEIIDGIETEEDAYLAIGECVKMGLIDNYLKLFAVYNGNEVGFTVSPKNVEELMGAQMLAAEDEDEEDEEDSPSDKMIEMVIEGLGLSADGFVGFDVVEEFFIEMSQSSVDELKEFIQSAIQEELLPYCGDEHTMDITGQFLTTEDYFNNQVNDLFTYSISRAFNELYVTEETREQFKAYGEELRGVFGKRIENSTWLSDGTKQQALNKLANMQFCLGGPDEWCDEYAPEVKGELFVDDIVELKTTRSRIIEAALGKDTRDESMLLVMFAPGGMSLNTNNSVYTNENNTVNIFPIYMMEPEYAPNMDEGKMYAAFYVFGHEITHGFDLDGSKYDAFGNETDWWTAEDRIKFEALNEEFSEHIGAHEVAPGINAPTENTIGENVADLGGLNIAFDALTAYLTKKGVTGEELKTKQRTFFEHYAYRYRVDYSAAEFQKMLSDEHSMGSVRVNGMVQHMDAWYELYDVVEGDSLYLPEEERVVIW